MLFIATLKNQRREGGHAHLHAANISCEPIGCNTNISTEPVIRLTIVCVEIAGHANQQCARLIF